MPGPRLSALARTLVAATTALTLSAAAAAAQVYRVAEMTAPQIRALDRAKTVVILPGGVLEEHGPHLPAFTDGYMNAWVTERLAEAIVARPGWAVLVFPMMPAGDGGFNQAGGRNTFPGTYGVRTSTLRAVHMDLATELGEQGFRWVFVMHGHGSPLHNRALHQAGDYFRDTYGGRMVNLQGLNLPPLPSERVVPEPALTAAERQEVGVDVHAGQGETSRMLFVRPDLVDRGFRQLAPITVTPAVLQRGYAGLQTMDAVRAPDWPGYVSSPRLASAAYGAATLQNRANRYNAAALRILDGLDERTLSREDGGPPVTDFPYYSEVERKQRAWMDRQGIKP
jgi:creatinine amidohydrolase/Fe(II)-dependent formamide hydrolase-like protein